MKTFQDYQPINLPWLMEIPSHWEIRRNKNIFSEMKEEVGERSSDYTLLSLTLNGIIPRNMEAGGKFPADFGKYKVVKKGYMAFCLFDIDETPRTVGLSEYDGMLTGAYTIMQVSKINSRYILYYYLSLDNSKQLKPFYKSLRKTINIDTFQSIKIPVPPRDEQDQIVRFLDWKVSEINRLINAKHQQIERLEELKKTVVSRVVTRGLNADVKMKDSGVNWIGDIPEHWEMLRTKKEFSSHKGLSITKADLKETGIAVINYGQIHSKKNLGTELNDELIKFVDESYLAANNSCLVKKGDFIFADTSENIEGCGNCVYIDLDKTILAGYHSIILRSNNPTNNKYFAYLFTSDIWRYQIREKVNGVKVYSITQKMLKETFLLVPPIEEQQQIVAYLDEQMQKIEAAIANKQKQIETLQELKTRLISDVVTGKIDVRGVEIPDYEYVEEESDMENTDVEDEASDEEATEQEDQ